MKSKLQFIFILLCLFFIGNTIQSHIFKKLSGISANNEIGLINHSFKNSPDITFWGSSTCSMSFIPEIITDSLNVSAYNYGISGIQPGQLLHLKQFALKQKNKKLLLVLNPFNFFENSHSYRDENSLFIHQINKDAVYKHFKKQSMTNAFSLKYVGLYGVFKLNDKYWNYLVNENLNEFPHQKGYLDSKLKFRNINNKYTSEVALDLVKLNDIKNSLLKIKRKNKIIIIIPPILNTKIIESIKELEKEVKPYCDLLLNYSENTNYKDTLLFQDYIHLNHKGATKITQDLIKYLK